MLWYQKQSKRIMKSVAALKQKDIAIEINESQQTVSYRLKNLYPEMLEDLLRIMKLAGYEVKEIDEDE